MTLVPPAEGLDVIRRKKRLLWALAVLLAVVVAVQAVDFGYETWHVSAMCPKCLQRARIHEK